MKPQIIVFILLLPYCYCTAQVGINTTSPAAGSILDVESAEKGILIPRVDITDLNTIAPVTGGSTESLLVYNTNSSSGKGFYYWNGSSWVNLNPGDYWKLDGNSGTSNGTHFLGTTDAQDLDIRTNNTLGFRFTQKGQFEFLTDNIFIGENAGDNIDTSFDRRSIFVGKNTGMNTTSGIQNNFIGEDAGLSNTTGSFNNFFGTDAGRSITTGQNNNFFGDNAGRLTTTAWDNCFFGTSSGTSNTIGEYNSFFGGSAGTYNTIGSYNAFFGSTSGFNNTTGSYNVFFGDLSGLKNTTGMKNTFLGTQSGQAITTGSGNIYLGFSAGRNIAPGTSDRLIIENSSDLTTPLIYGDFSANLVGIGTSSLIATLTVEGEFVLSADGSALSGEAGLYRNTGELYAFDTAGNSTVISPHNFSLIKEGPSEEMAWSFYSKNMKTGKQVNVDMMKAIRLIEQLSGSRLIYMTDQDGNSLTGSDSQTTKLDEMETLKTKIDQQEALINELLDRVKLLESKL